MSVQRTTGLAGTAARGGIGYQVVMAAIGFVGGLVVVVPAVLWLVAARTPPQADSPRRAPTLLSEAAVAANGGGHSVAPQIAPALAERPAPAAAPVDSESLNRKPAADSALQSARASIRAGDIATARRLLSVPEFASHGEALFMLAETYDPTILAALGMGGLLADAQRARRLYEAAREQGMVAAVRRLEQLRP